MSLDRLIGRPMPVVHNTMNRLPVHLAHLVGFAPLTPPKKTGKASRAAASKRAEPVREPRATPHRARTPYISPEAARAIAEVAAEATARAKAEAISTSWDAAFAKHAVTGSRQQARPAEQADGRSARQRNIDASWDAAFAKHAVTAPKERNR